VRIDKDRKTDLLNTLSESARSKSQNEKATGNTRVAASDEVKLSGIHRDVAKIATKVKETSSIRQDKVDAIKAAIENGTYKVDGKQVAKAILKNNILDEML